VSPRLVALAAAAALGACAFLPRAPQPSTLEGEWARTRDAESRRAYLYDGLIHRATVTATHLSLAVREARARRLAEWLGWTPAELEAHLVRERQEAAAREEFVVSFFTADPHVNDLDAPRSSWRVALKVEGADLLPTRVTTLGHESEVTGLFPYVGPFDTVYQVLVPMPQAGPIAGLPFVLEISSTLGKLDMDFGRTDGAPLFPQQPAPPP
jgi:hypothetical protein